MSQTDPGLDALTRALAHPIDSRKMCFQQGKAFVWMPDPDSEVVITEWPNGVIDTHRLSDSTVSRAWPDGRVEHYREGEPEDREAPYLPPVAE